MGNSTKIFWTNTLAVLAEDVRNAWSSTNRVPS